MRHTTVARRVIGVIGIVGCSFANAQLAPTLKPEERLHLFDRADFPIGVPCSPSSPFICQARLPDPTILWLPDGQGDGWFFVTGTSDALNTRNFEIYRSRNLVTWEYHGTAFPDPGFGNVLSLNDHVDIGIPRRFRQLWSPQLYVDPTSGPIGSRRVYVTFAAIELTASDFEGHGFEARTGMVASISEQDLIAGGHFASPCDADGNFEHEPVWYTYFAGNAQCAPAIPGCTATLVDPCSYNYDGGLAHAGTPASPPQDRIPVTGSMYNVHRGSGAGRAAQLDNSGIGAWTHNDRSIYGPSGGETWIYDGLCVFFDPVNNHRPWLLYNTYEPGINHPSAGNNTYAIPMRTPHTSSANSYGLLDAFAASNPITPVGSSGYTGEFFPLFYAFNTSSQFGPIPNGAYDLVEGQWTPGGVDAGVAEAPDLFFNRFNGKYYVSVSRNTFDSAAYQVVYRYSESGIASLAQEWEPAAGYRSASEAVLVASDFVQTSSGGSDPSDDFCYGSGHMFEAFGRVYMVMHEKQQGSNTRFPLVKELTIENSGSIRRLFQTFPGNDPQSLERFLGRVRIPDVTRTGATLAGQPGFGEPDFNVDLDDLGYFLNFWLASDGSVADLTTTGATLQGQPGYGQSDGSVDLDDLGYFINLWTAFPGPYD